MDTGGRRPTRRRKAARLSTARRGSDKAAMDGPLRGLSRTRIENKSKEKREALIKRRQFISVRLNAVAIRSVALG